MTKREGELKSAVTRELKRQLPNFLSLLQLTAGAPDRALVGSGRTTWWEFKHATPDFDSPANQELMCRRLNVQGYCRYVIWWESAAGLGQRTMIVTPAEVSRRKMFQSSEHGPWHCVPESFTLGFDHHWLVNQIRRVHHV